MGRSAPLPALLLCACVLLPTARAQFGGLIGKVIQAAVNSEEAKQAKSNATHSVEQGMSNSFRTANQQAVVQTSEYGLEVHMPQSAKVGERYMFPIEVTNFLVDPIELTVVFSVPNNTVLDTKKTFKGFKLGGAADNEEKGLIGGSRQSDEDTYAAKLRLGTDDDKRKKTLEVYATTSEPGDIMWNVRILRTSDITPGFLPKLITIEPLAPSSHAAAAATKDEGAQHTTGADADAEDDDEEDTEEEEKEGNKSSDAHATAGDAETSQAATNSSSSTSVSDSAASHTTAAAASEDAEGSHTAAAADTESPSSSSSTSQETSSSASSTHKKSASSSGNKQRSSSVHNKKVKSSSSRSSLKTTAAARGRSKKPVSSSM